MAAQHRGTPAVTRAESPEASSVASPAGPAGRRLDRGLSARQLQVAGAVILVVALLAVLVVYVVGRLNQTKLGEALAAVPSQTLRMSFTDWSAVRSALGNPTLDTAAQINAFDRHAYNRDLTSASSIDESMVALHDKYGFSPTNADWEAYAQSREGAAMVLQLPADTDMGAIEDRLASLGYRRPSAPDGVWLGGTDLVSGISQTISPELQYVVVLAGQHRVISSDTATYAAGASQVSTGSQPSLSGTDPAIGQLEGQAGDTAAAFVWAGDFACTDLGTSELDAGDQRLGRQVVGRTGGVTPLNGMLISMDAARSLQVVMAFGSSAQAVHDLRPRATLAVGPVVGGSGNYADYFRLLDPHTAGSDVVLTLQPRTPYSLSRVDSGPQVFAAC